MKSCHCTSWPRERFSGYSTGGCSRAASLSCSNRMAIWGSQGRLDRVEYWRGELERKQVPEICKSDECAQCMCVRRHGKVPQRLWGSGAILAHNGARNSLFLSTSYLVIHEELADYSQGDEGNWIKCYSGATWQTLSARANRIKLLPSNLIMCKKAQE